jgi:hypothetical protein
MSVSKTNFNFNSLNIARTKPMYSFAQRKFALLPFVVLAIASITVLSNIQPTGKSQSQDQPSKVSITRIGNAMSLLNEKIKPSPADLEAVKGFSFPFESTKADSAIDCQVSIKGRLYTKC